jgi:Zn-dependent peptidase ImmA (M78 family)
MGKRSSKELLPHGFKANAERIAVCFRAELGKKAYDPLSAFDLAKHLKIKIFSPSDIGLSDAECDKIMGNDSGWSAFTMKNKKAENIIIHNAYHSQGRQQSNLMHEISHIYCDHRLPEPTIIPGLALPLREYKKEFEDEANCLGRTLQIPRDGLLWALKRGMNENEIAEYFIASREMVVFRINTTGVKNQMKYWRNYSY